MIGQPKVRLKLVMLYTIFEPLELEIHFCMQIQLHHRTASNQGTDYVANDYVILPHEFQVFCGMSHTTGKETVLLIKPQIQFYM